MPKSREGCGGQVRGEKILGIHGKGNWYVGGIKLEVNKG